MNNSDKFRLDKWLWAARFYKTRNIAKEAIDGGKVHLNGQRCKPGRQPKIGDVIKIRIGWSEQIVVVKMLSNKRQSSEVAQQMYEETDESRIKREQQTISRKLLKNDNPRPKKRPDKKERREIIKRKSDF